jgi:toluene monooxygenase system protein D
MENAVGPVLRMGDNVELVLRAIQEDNPDGGIEIIDRGSYVRVQRSNYLVLTRASLERHLGPGFKMHQVESMMSSFAGRIRTSTDQIVWQLKNSGGG